jgi:hypothetical protein
MIQFVISFGPNRKLMIYSDTNYASDKSDRKSIIAAIGLLGGGLIY